MKGLLLLFLVFMVSCNDHEPPLPADLCPSCSSSMELNGTSWPSKPQYAWFQFVEPTDTLFTLEIAETNPLHDTFNDAFLFWHIPLECGEYRLDENTYAAWGTDVTFHVYEVEYGTATEMYWPVYDGSSVIHVESLNKSTGEFLIRFKLFLYPDGNPDAEIHNSTYPSLIEVDGQAQGMITYE